MTLDEILNPLRDFEIRLRSSEVQNFFHGQPENVRRRFVSFRQEVSFLVGKLINAQLANIANKLDELSDDIRAGINELKGKIDELNNAVAILAVLAALLGLVARIAVLAA